MPTAHPKLSAFPKAWMDPLSVTGELTLRQWIEMAATLKVDGLEMYSGFIDLKDPKNWPEIRKIARTMA